MVPPEERGRDDQNRFCLVRSSLGWLQPGLFLQSIIQISSDFLEDRVDFDVKSSSNVWPEDGGGGSLENSADLVEHLFSVLTQLSRQLL